MKRPISPPRRAFTLVELVVCFLIGSFILMFLSRLLSNSIRSFSKSSNTLSMTQGVDLFLARLEADIRAAREVSKCDTDLIRMKISGIDSGGRIIAQTVEYSVLPDRNGVARKTVEGGEIHPFCRELVIEKMKFSKSPSRGAIMLDLQVKVPPTGKEKMAMKRSFSGGNLPESELIEGFRY